VTRSGHPSAQTIAVVLALAAEPSAWRHGYVLCQQLGLKPGSLYPILVRPAGCPGHGCWSITGGSATAFGCPEWTDRSGCCPLP